MSSSSQLLPQWRANGESLNASRGEKEELKVKSVLHNTVMYSDKWLNQRLAVMLSSLCEKTEM